MDTFAEALGATHVTDCRRLGDLDDQPPWIDTVTVELALDVGEHASVCDRQGGQVDGHTSVSPSKLAAQQGDHLADHHAVDLLDQAIALGGRQEAAGRRERAAGIVRQADQRLVVGDRSPLQRDDRLVVKHEQVLAQRVAQAPKPRARMQPGRRGETGRSGWIAPAPVLLRAHVARTDYEAGAGVGCGSWHRGKYSSNATRTLMGVRVCGGFRPKAAANLLKSAQSCPETASV